MNILVDEHIPLVTVGVLRSLGHDVRDIRGTPDGGMDDPDLWSMSILDRRMLITIDKGFLNYRATPHFGLLIVRLRRPNRDRIHQRVIEALSRVHTGDNWRNITVVMRDVAHSTWGLMPEP